MAPAAELLAAEIGHTARHGHGAGVEHRQQELATGLGQKCCERYVKVPPPQNGENIEQRAGGVQAGEGELRAGVAEVPRPEGVSDGGGNTVLLLGKSWKTQSSLGSLKAGSQPAARPRLPAARKTLWT